MSFRARVVASAALATASFLLAPSALAASHPVQVTGNQLKSALLTQAVTLSELPGFSLTLNTLVTVEGTDVFTVVSLSGTNDPVSASAMLKFVNRVKKLR